MTKNVLILASPRSGSSLLQILLGKSFYSNWYPELFINSDVEKTLKRYSFMAEENKSLVLKLMYIHLHHSITDSQLEIFRNFLYDNKFYIIRLWRNDLREEVFSWAIASISREFIYQSSNKIECPYDVFYKSFNFILNCKIALKDNYFNIPIDQEICYEDVINGNVIINNINIGGPDSFRPFFSRPSLPKSEKVLNLNDMYKWYDQLKKTYEEKIAYVS